MALTRSVVPELLDGLAVCDPAAIRSRRDLRRVHQAMGTRAILLQALDSFALASSTAPLRILELGAGDGSLMLGVARALKPRWTPVELSLLDQQALLDEDTVRAYAQLGWTASNRISDVHDWARATTRDRSTADPAARWDLIVANLFLHHFDGEQLAMLLAAVARVGTRFVACEPRRSRLALVASQLIGAIGVNAVTRNDAVASVRAGFRDKEITDSWPAQDPSWVSREYPAGAFSHCFVATRTAQASP